MSQVCVPGGQSPPPDTCSTSCLRIFTIINGFARVAPRPTRLCSTRAEPATLNRRLGTNPWRQPATAQDEVDQCPAGPSVAVDERFELGPGNQPFGASSHQSNVTPLFQIGLCYGAADHLRWMVLAEPRELKSEAPRVTGDLCLRPGLVHIPRQAAPRPRRRHRTPSRGAGDRSSSAGRPNGGERPCSTCSRGRMNRYR